MSRNKFIILITIAVILLGLIIYLVLKPNTPVIPGEGGSNTSLFPFLNSKKSTTKQPTETGEFPPTPAEGEEEYANSPTYATLTQISSTPVAGGISYLKDKEIVQEDGTIKKEKIIAVRYAEKSRGFIYEKSFDNMAIERRISTTTIPHIEDALFLDEGNTVILRYLGSNLQTIQTFVGSVPKVIPGGDSASTLRGYFLAENIRELVTSSDGTKFFHLMPSNDGVIGILTTLATNKKSQFFESTFSDWLISLSKDGGYAFFNTKPSSTVPGFLYRVTVPQNKLVKMVGGINGLTSLPSPSGGKILYADSTLALSSFAAQTQKTVSMGIKTMPEKCIWKKDGVTAYCFVPNSIPNVAYPDSWYDGSISFSDSLWQINTDTGATTFLENVSSGTKGIFDATKIFMSPDETTIFFTNKKDYTLWSYKLNP